MSLATYVLFAGYDQLLKLRSDQTDCVSVDLNQQRLNGDERLLSFGHTCGHVAQPNDQEPPFNDSETPAAGGHKRTDSDQIQSGRLFGERNRGIPSGDARRSTDSASD